MPRASSILTRPDLDASVTDEETDALLALWRRKGGTAKVQRLDVSPPVEPSPQTIEGRLDAIERRLESMEQKMDELLQKS